MIATSPEQFADYLFAPEGINLEFKAARGGFHFDELVDYCAALCNEGGGKIFLGITDKRPRQVVGTTAFSEPGRTEAGIYERLHRQVPIEEYQHGSHRVLIVHVPGRFLGRPALHKGCALMRAGDALVPMSDDQLRLIYREVEPDFSAEICSEARIHDLVPEAIASFRERWARKSSNPRPLTLSNEQALSDAELLTAEGVTYAALLLFGSRTALSRHLPQAEVVFEYRSSEAPGPAQNRENLREGFLLFHDTLWERINLRNDRQSYQDNFFRVEIPTFDEGPIREAVLNAISHRDYRLAGSTFVRQYARRLEVVSPGGFPPGITVENVLDQQQPRNRRLAEAFARCGLIERSGQGMDIMFERAVRQSKPLPDFTGTAAHEVRLTLRGQMGNPAFVRYLERVGQDRLGSFSTRDFLVLEALQRGQTVPEAFRPRLPGLMEAGVIESVGRGRSIRYHLSRGLYAHLGTKGVYTRRRGLDHETNKELLLKHLRDNADTGSPLAELCQVLPAVSESGIQRMLSELREDGRAVLRGNRRWARWHSSAKAQLTSLGDQTGL